MTDRELLAEIKHLCRRHAHFGVNAETHRLCAEIAKRIERHEGEMVEGERKGMEVGHG